MQRTCSQLIPQLCCYAIARTCPILESSHYTSKHSLGYCVTHQHWQLTGAYVLAAAACLAAQYQPPPQPSYSTFMLPSLPVPCLCVMLVYQSELTDWGRNPPDGCCLEACDPITHWTIIMAGPEGSAGLPRLYEGEVFRWV
jgi:hypothetical protein